MNEYHGQSSLIMNITGQANDTNDILQMFR